MSHEVQQIEFTAKNTVRPDPATGKKYDLCWNFLTCGLVVEEDFYWWWLFIITTFHQKWKEELVSTEFLLVWIMLHTELSSDTAGMALRTRVPVLKVPSSSQPHLQLWLHSSAHGTWLQCESAFQGGAESVELGQWSVLWEGLPSADSKHANTSTEFRLAGNTPRALKAQTSTTKEHEPRRSQVAICGQHLHDLKLVQLLTSCPWGRSAVSKCLSLPYRGWANKQRMQYFNQ